MSVGCHPAGGRGSGRGEELWAPSKVTTRLVLELVNSYLNMVYLGVRIDNIKMKMVRINNLVEAALLFLWLIFKLIQNLGGGNTQVTQLPMFRSKILPLFMFSRTGPRTSQCDGLIRSLRPICIGTLVTVNHCHSNCGEIGTCLPKIRHGIYQ